MYQLIHININGVNLSLNISIFLVWLQKKKKLSHRSLSNRSQPPLFLILLLLLPSQAPLQALPHSCQHHLARWWVLKPLLLSFHGTKVIHRPTTTGMNCSSFSSIAHQHLLLEIERNIKGHPKWVCLFVYLTKSNA